MVCREITIFAVVNQKERIMTELTVRDFRNQLGKSFDRAAAGEKVYIRRKDKLYTLVSVDTRPVAYDDIDDAGYPEVAAEEVITPELQAAIDEARKEFRNGKCIHLRTPEDIDRYFAEL